MTNEFSKTTKLWLQKQDVLMAAEERFRREWAAILIKTQTRMAADGWLSRRWGEPLDMIQLSRNSWPNSPAGIHYEIICNSEFCRRDIVDLSLHVEQDIPEQELVCERLRELLRPYAAQILKTLAPCTPVMPDEPLHDIVKGSLPLVDVSVDSLTKILQDLIQTKSFVDEALFSAGKETIWRTDFSANSPPVCLGWFGNDGGQQIAAQMGRFNSAAMRINGTRPNARREMSFEQGCYSLIIEDTDKIENDVEYYVCIVLKTNKGGKLHIRGDGHKGLTPEGYPAELPLAFLWECMIERADQWQCLIWQGKIPSVKKAGYNFSKSRTWIVMNVDTPDTEFLIDSIEIGRCE